MATQKKINNSTEHWAEILHQQWGVKAKLNELNGEYDLNFLAISSSHNHIYVMHFCLAISSEIFTNFIDPSEI